MLTIRREQVAALRVPAIKAFEDRVAAHLEKCFPKECQALGAAASAPNRSLMHICHTGSQLYQTKATSHTIAALLVTINHFERQT